MDLLALLPTTPGLLLTDLHFDHDTHHVVAHLALAERNAACPACQQRSTHLHSRYSRRILDLPWADWTVCLHLNARKFRCRNLSCHKRVFCERLPSLVAPWARRTIRLTAEQRALGLTVGGNVGARLSSRRAAPVSRSTLLRLVRAQPPPVFATPRVLGVDDWAIRKGMTYGTILVDLERSQPIALLPDREAETLRAWLETHPGVEIVARDRFPAFADGVRLGAPNARHVLDRFHLMQNLSVTLEKVLSRHRDAISTASHCPLPAVLPEVVDPVVTAVTPEPASAASPPSGVITLTPGLPTTKSKERRQERIERFETIKALHGKGWTVSAIARHLNTDRRTVRRAIESDVFPEFKRPAKKLDPYKAHLVRRWNEGCRTAPLLLEEIRAQGYTGSRTIVAIYLQRLREAQGLPRRSRNAHPDHPTAQVNVRDVDAATLTPFQAALSVLRRPEKRTDEDEALLSRLVASGDEVREAVELSRAFACMVRERQAADLDSWLERASKSSAVALSRFARGLQREAEGVRAALSLPWSTGPVEGYIHRLKLLKRQMYGRAKLDLLERRFLARPEHQKWA